MAYAPDSREQRRDPRVSSELLTTISVGSQLTLEGRLKDLSSKSAFIRVKSNIFLAVHDEISFVIQCTTGTEDVIQGLARVSRVVMGEGIAVYFTKMDDASAVRLKTLLVAMPPAA